MIEPGKPLQHRPFENHAENADGDGSDDQRRPISDPGHVEQKIGAERAHHVERTMRKIDDVEHAEDHGEPKTEQRVERAVDQSNQELGVKGLHRSFSRSTDQNETFGGTMPPNVRGYFFSRAHVLLSSGVKAWSPATVPISFSKS